jgi:AbrB family looped-hinge helix DNA binding protein
VTTNAERKSEPCCQPNEISSCSVESIITIDERGQMVLPKDIRERAEIKPGDKLALLCLRKGDKVCCLSLIKVDVLEDMVKSRLGPVMNEAFQE